MNHFLIIEIIILLGLCQGVQCAGDTQLNWTYGLLSCLLVSFLGFFFAILVVSCKSCTNSNKFEIILKGLVGFAIGALLGDAFIHLLPDAFGGSHEEEASTTDAEATETPEGELEDVRINISYSKPSQKYLPSTFLILGILLFFIVEKIMILLMHHYDPNSKNAHSHGHSHGHDNGHEHGHNHGHNHDKCPPPLITVNQQEQRQDDEQLNIIECKEPSPQKNENQVEVVNQGGDSIKAETQVEEFDANTLSKWEQICSCKAWKGKNSLGYLMLVSSFLHNFLDGLAIGMLFGTGNYASAVTTLIAIIIHEIGHEIGDVSILLSQKFTPLQTIICNGSINFSALLGGVLGLSIGEIKNEAYLTAFVAGNFIYIGAIDMFPELIGSTNLKETILQSFTMCLGFAAMFAILSLE